MLCGTSLQGVSSLVNNSRPRSTIRNADSLAEQSLRTSQIGMLTPCMHLDALRGGQQLIAVLCLMLIDLPLQLPDDCQRRLHNVCSLQQATNQREGR